MSTDASSIKKQPWGPNEVRAWRDRQTRVRFYHDQVVVRMNRMPRDVCVVEKYGTLTSDALPYTLLRARVGDLNNGKPNILITGGVHGYEMSGILAPMVFLERHAKTLSQNFNFLVYTCISPWAMEAGHRWNQDAMDTNRHFKRDGVQTPECVAFMNSIDSLGARFRVAIDLHETNNHDIALEAERADKDGDEPDGEPIPQGFYLVMDPRNKNSALGPRVIDAVSKVTRIAPEEKFFGVPSQNGVMYLEKPGLCMGFALQHAREAITTEVYPDIIPPDEAIEGQIAAIMGALHHASLEP